MKVQNWNCKSKNCLCKCLSKINAFATKKRIKANWIATASTWRLWPLAFRIETVWNELGRFLLLRLIVMHGFNTNSKWISTSESEVFDGNISIKALWWRNRYRRLNYEWIVKTILHKVKVLHSFVRQLIVYVCGYLINNGHKFIKKAFLKIRQLW